jgi:protein-S-isoprenylcysteine O-methyltransferase Ste14
VKATGAKLSGSLWAATDFEVRHRSLVLISIYLFAFAFWPLDRHDVASYFRMVLPAGSPAVQLSYFIAAVPALAGAAVGTWAFAYLSGCSLGGQKPGGTEMVTAGPYRFVRHPLYLATLLDLIAFAFLLNRLGFVIVVLGSLELAYRVILREEAGLLAAYGEDYKTYRQRVPMLLPALDARWRGGTAVANWGAGWLGGAYLWLLAGSLLVLAASLKESLFYATLVAALAARLISVRWGRHRVATAT